MTGSQDSVLVISQYFPPETGAGSVRWDELTERWGTDASVTVLTSAPDYPDGDLYEGYDNAWLRRERRGDVEVLYTKTVTAPSGNLLRRSLKFVWFMLAATVVGVWKTSPTVVVATSPQPLTGVAGWLVARFRRARFVFEVRDLWPESITSVSDVDSRLVTYAIDRTVGFLYRRSDRLVVVSEAFVEPIVERGVDRSTIGFHPNGIDPDAYEDPSAGATQASSGDPSAEVIQASSEDPPEAVTPPSFFDDRFTVAYVGTIGRAHGLSVVLEAAKRVPDVHFVLVGTGAEHEVLADRASDLDNVTLTGRRPKAAVPHVLAASDAALVHLKDRDVFRTVIPSKLLEAMAAGLPVVLGVRGEAERILRAAEAGVTFTPEDPESLAEAVSRLADDDQLCSRLGTNGRAYVSANFSWDEIAPAYLAWITAPSADGPETRSV